MRRGGARGDRQDRQRGAAAAQRRRRRGGLPARERRRAHAEGLPRGLGPAARGRLDGLDRPARVRRPGYALHRRRGGERADDLGQPRLLDVRLPHPRRLRRPRPPRHRRAQGRLPAQARRRHLGGHHVPHRAAVRHRPRPRAHPAPSTPATAPTRSPAARSSSPPATTTSPRTSSTWCWRALPDAPPGIKGISMFLIPKLRPEGGTPGPQRRHLHRRSSTRWGSRARPPASSTSTAPIGYLVGEPHKGMRAMFTMMNAARLHVGVQGLAHRRVRLPGARSPSRASACRGARSPAPSSPQQEADPILVHPDVRRMLLTIRAFVEGARALTAWAAIEIDHAENEPRPRTRAGRATTSRR